MTRMNESYKVATQQLLVTYNIQLTISNSIIIIIVYKLFLKRNYCYTYNRHTIWNINCIIQDIRLSSNLVYYNYCDRQYNYAQQSFVYHV